MGAASPFGRAALAVLVLVLLLAVVLARRFGPQQTPEDEAAEAEEAGLDWRACSACFPSVARALSRVAAIVLAAPDEQQ